MTAENTLFFSKKAFTLVELIVVIAVLAVLSSIAFTSVGNISQSARNSVRLSHLSSISSELQGFLSQGKTLPLPENRFELIASGAVVGYQGDLWAEAIRSLAMGDISDPNTKQRYSYTINKGKNAFSLFGLGESSSYIPLANTYAATATTIHYTKGDLLGTILDSATRLPLQQVALPAGASLDIVSTPNNYTVQFTDSINLSGTGLAIGGPLWALLAKGADFSAPTSCPTGFIPVIGNMDFLQPWFCVMKYEARALGGAINAGNIHNYTISDTIVSTKNDPVIANITAAQAVAACKSIGEGYHLVTNHEWMTLARSAEIQADNWTGGIVGSGAFYSGYNNNDAGTPQIASDDTDGYKNTGYTAASTGVGKLQRRTHTISNGKIIWDLGGNVREIVGKANTYNGANIDIGTSRYDSASKFNCPWGGDNDCFELPSAKGTGLLFAGWKGTYASGSGSVLGFGMGYQYDGVASNVFLRGGDCGDGLYAGIYALTLDSTMSDKSNRTGFRCAK